MVVKSGKKGDFKEKAIDGKLLSSALIDSLRLFALEKRLSDGQIKAIFSENASKEIRTAEDAVPIEIFSSKKLSALEAIVKYLKEESGRGFTGIASAMRRSSRTIWATHHNAVKKMPERFSIDLVSMHVPLHVFKDRRFGVQESLVKYLKEDEGLSYHKIALLLNRDDRTIWTAYSRTVKKSDRR